MIKILTEQITAFKLGNILGKLYLCVNMNT